MDDKIVQIKIHLESNIPTMTAGTVFTSDMLYISQHDKDESEEPIPSGKMPYFTVYTRYSKQNLQNSSKGGLYRAFFDEETFKRTLGKNLDGSLSEDDKHSNAMYNIQFMLTNLFPITFPVKDNFHDTFQENIKRVGTNITSSSSSNWIKQIQHFFSGKEDEKNDAANGSLRYGGSIYSVVEIVLLNDVINNPFYQPFIQQVRLFGQWKEKQIDMLIKKKQSNSKKFIDLLAKLSQDLSQPKKDEIKDEIEEIKKSFRSRSTGESPERFERLFEQLLNAITTNNETAIKNVLLNIEKINLTERRSSRGYRSSIPTSFSEMRSYRSIQQWSTENYFLDETLKYISDIDEYMKLFSLRDEQLTPLDLKVRVEIKKYRELYSFVEKVKSFIRTYSSSNPVLQKQFRNVSALIKFFTEVNVSKSKKSIQQNLDAYEVGLIQESSLALEQKEKEKSKQSDFTFSAQQHTCEIYVRLDTVKGILSPANLSAIRCMYRNASLIQQYYKVTDKELNPLLLYKNRRLIDIDMLVKKGKTQKKRPDVENKKKGGFQPSLRSTPSSLYIEQNIESTNPINGKEKGRRRQRKPIQKSRKNKKNVIQVF